MKTILITGSTDGIGKLTAIKLAKKGHQVLLHGRNEKKLRQTINEIKELSGNDTIFGVISNLSDFKSIETMIQEIKTNYQKIDILINNAGVYTSRIQRNEQNLDMRFAVNYFAPYLLTENLLPLLKQSDAPRVINLSSAAQASVSIPALKGNKNVTESNAYAQSKLALTMWSFVFAKKHPEINTIAVNPGSLLNTKMANEAFGNHWAPADKGATILYELALSNAFAESNGKYFDNDKGDFNKAHDDAYNTEKVATLIDVTKNILSV